MLGMRTFFRLVHRCDTGQIVWVHSNESANSSPGPSDFHFRKPDQRVFGFARRSGALAASWFEVYRG